MFLHVTSHTPRRIVTRPLLILYWIRKIVSGGSAWVSGYRTRRALVRVAETAPHLLADAGFAPDGVGIWRHGTTCVHLHDGEARVHSTHAHHENCRPRRGRP